MITKGYLYVDKTKQIYDLITGGRYYFVSRPRRFGKSLLISTLKEIFLGNKQLFDDLWIAQSDYEWEPHPVIQLDMSKLVFDSTEELKKSLSWMIEFIAQTYNIDVSQAPSGQEKLEYLVKQLEQKFSQGVVILIDEYDYPLINNLDNMPLAAAHAKVLKNFFGVIKSLDEHLRAIFITGVTKFSKTFLFSGLNNLNDLTIDPRAATLLGYTHEELSYYFPAYIEEVATAQHSNREAIEEEMEDWYNGYRFSKIPTKVFNPFSVLYYLTKKECANYWIQSGTPGFLISLLRKQSPLLNNFDEREFSELTLSTFDIEHIPLITLLFQTGYLTIQDFDPSKGGYWLGFPNREVKESFQKYLLVAFSDTDIPTVEEITGELRNSLKENDLDTFCHLLQSLFAHIPYQLHIPQERYYHLLLQMIARLLDLDSQSEIATDKGRIDLIISTDKYIYLFECKFNKSAQAGLAQIEDRAYYERYRMMKKPIILVGISFNREDNKLCINCTSKKLT